MWAGGQQNHAAVRAEVGRFRLLGGLLAHSPSLRAPAPRRRRGLGSMACRSREWSCLAVLPLACLLLATQFGQAGGRWAKPERELASIFHSNIVSMHQAPYPSQVSQVELELSRGLRQDSHDHGPARALFNKLIRSQSGQDVKVGRCQAPRVRAMHAQAELATSGPSQCCSTPSRSHNQRSLPPGGGHWGISNTAGQRHPRCQRRHCMGAQ